MRIPTLHINVPLRASDKEAVCLLHSGQALEVDVAEVHGVERPASGINWSRILTSCSLRAMPIGPPLPFNGYAAAYQCDDECANWRI